MLTEQFRKQRGAGIVAADKKYPGLVSWDRRKRNADFPIELAQAFPQNRSKTCAFHSVQRLIGCCVIFHSLGLVCDYE